MTEPDPRLTRIARGEAPRVLDLFSGAGGISLGFSRAGFRIDGSVEMDALAARTHAANFGHPAHARDITQTEPADLGLDAVDVLVGGPPCQAYARVGRAKLREVADHPAAFKVDPRGNLYLRYLAWVGALRPLALLIENVPDILHYGHHNVAEEIVETLDAMGYDAKYSLINSAFHGTPQMRDRVFLIAYRRDLGCAVRFPAATRHMTLPRGYAGTRAVALKHVGAGFVSADLGGPGRRSAAHSGRIGPPRRPPLHGPDRIRRAGRLFGVHRADADLAGVRGRGRPVRPRHPRAAQGCSDLPSHARGGGVSGGARAGNEAGGTRGGAAGGANGY